MYSLIIADDETAIRRGMSNFIDWESLGFEVVADFEDGRDTIDYLKENPVDVVLADIQMIEITGLQVAEYVQDNLPNTNVVIISSHQDFEYARQAVRFHVEHYLIKPIDIEEVKEVFTRIREKLDSRTEKDSLTFKGNEELEKMLPELQSHFFASLLMGIPLSREDLPEKLKALKLPILANAPYAVVNLMLSNGQDILNEPQILSGNNFIANIFGNDSGFFFSIVSLSKEEHRIIFTCTENTDRESFKEKLDSYLDSCIGSVRKLLGLEISYDIESVYGSVFDFEKRKYSIQAGGSNSGSGEGFDEEAYGRVLHQYRLLMDLIDSGEFNELEKVLDHIFFSYKDLPADQLRHFILNMFTLLSNKYRKMGSDEWELINKELEKKKFYELDSKREMMEACRDILRETRSSFEAKKSDTARNAVTHALEYMRSHYGEQLSLGQLSERYYLNPSYFSRIFKENTGETFTDRLIAIRMEEAMKFLKQGKLKVYEISEQVGYLSEKYFFRVFKQYTGMSPAEYQRSVSLRNDEE